MALLGSSVDPRLFLQDYSGFTRAAELQAQGMQNLGAGIVQGIKNFSEAREERKKLDAQVKADDVSIESAIKLGKSLGIDINSYLEPIQALRKDPNTTPAESLALGRAAAQGISNAFTLGIGAQERQSAAERARADAQYKQGMLEASQTRAAASLFGAQQKASEIKSEEVPVVNAVTGEKDSVLINRDAQGRMRDPETNKVIKDIFKYGNEMEGWEALEQPAMPTPTSQVGGSMSDSIASAAEMNIGKLSTAKTPGTQGGNMGCADAICRTFEMATGEELVPGGTLSTREMATNLNKDPRFVKVPFNEAKKGDIVLTPRKGNKAGHTGIVLDGGKIASNSSKGFAGKSPGTFTQNYTMDSWGRNVAPRNPSETAAYRYVGSQGIDNALAMGGDISSQAMGTPEQQAEAASQIEQGQQLRLATAQNIPQGAIPTEPSMATQQPQLPQQTAPQVNRRLLSSRTQGGARFRQATPEEVATYGTQGQVNTATGEFKPIRPPSGMVIEQTKDGRFRVVQGAGAVGRQEQAAQAAKEQGVERATMGTQEIGRALKALDSGVMQGSGPLASFYRAGAAKFVKGTPEYQLANNFIAPIKSMLAFNELNKMRMASPTGGALGNVAKFETDMLQQSAGQLDIDKTDPQTLRENLMRLQEKYLDVIHGSSEQRRKLLQEGKITKEQYFDIESSYPAFTMSATGETVPRQMEGVAPQAQESEADRILRELGE